MHVNENNHPLLEFYDERLIIMKIIIMSNFCLFWLNSLGMTPLHKACRAGQANVVTSLIRHGCDVNQGDVGGYPPLFEACHCGRADIVRILLKHGAFVTAKGVWVDAWMNG
jgi:ankyrin repeat protein